MTAMLSFMWLIDLVLWKHGILWPIVKYFKTKHQRGPLHSFHYADVTLEQIALSDLFLQTMIDKIATCR